MLNNLLGYELYVPSDKMKFPGIEDFLKRYQAQASSQGVDPLGYYVPPFVYAAMEIVGQAVEKTGSLDQGAIAKTIHANTFNTIVGPIRFAANGEWDKARMLMVQYRGIQGNGLDQLRDPAHYVVLFPAEFKSGDAQTPYPSK
jgi:branched-chain amino acid transport system substrate-binding protein